MINLPDTDQRIDDLLPLVSTTWNEAGYRCYCGNPLLIGSKKRIMCNRCHRYWNREDITAERVE